MPLKQSGDVATLIDVRRVIGRRVMTDNHCRVWVQLAQPVRSHVVGHCHEIRVRPNHNREQGRMSGRRVEDKLVATMQRSELSDDQCVLIRTHAPAPPLATRRDAR
jgi:hypothetical protein